MRFRTAALAAAAIAIAVPGQGVIAAGRTASFNVTAIHTGPGSKVTLNSKVWVTEQQARADVSNPVQGNIRFLVAGGSLYQIDPAKKKYVKSALPPEMKKKKDNFDALVGRFAFDAGDALKSARKLRSEKQAGFMCDVYTASAKEGDSSRKLTVWMPQKGQPRFPLKAVMEDQMKKPGAEASRTVTITLSNVKLNQPIPASIFATPRGFVEVKPKPAAAPRGK